MRLSANSFRFLSAEAAPIGNWGERHGSLRVLRTQSKLHIGLAQNLGNLNRYSELSSYRHARSIGIEANVCKKSEVDRMFKRILDIVDGGVSL